MMWENIRSMAIDELAKEFGGNAEELPRDRVEAWLKDRGIEDPHTIFEGFDREDLNNFFSGMYVMEMLHELEGPTF